MFIEAVGDKTITYRIRDKETGFAMEPLKESIFEIFEGKAHFDNVRYIDLQVLGHVKQVLEA